MKSFTTPRVHSKLELRGKARNYRIIPGHFIYIAIAEYPVTSLVGVLQLRFPCLAHVLGRF